MPSANYCSCGCGVTPTNYRKKFYDVFPTGYPFMDTGKYYCGGEDCNAVMSWCSKLHIDHIVPKAMGGENCLHNLRPLCFHCNTKKGATFSQKDIILSNAGDKHAKREVAKKKFSKKY